MIEDLISYGRRRLICANDLTSALTPAYENRREGQMRRRRLTIDGID